MNIEVNHNEEVKPKAEEGMPVEATDLELDYISGARPQPLYGVPGTV